MNESSTLSSSSFRIYVNGHDTGKSLSYGSITVSAYVDGGFDKDCYDDQQTTLFYDDIIEKKEIPFTVVDYGTQKVHVKLSPNEKSAKLTVITDGCNDFNKIKLTIGAKMIPITGQMVMATFKGSTLKQVLTNKLAKVAYDGSDYKPQNADPAIIMVSEGDYLLKINFSKVEKRLESPSSASPDKDANEPTLIITLKGFNQELFDRNKYNDAFEALESRSSIRIVIEQTNCKVRYSLETKVLSGSEKYVIVKLPSDWNNKICSVLLPDWRLGCRNVRVSVSSKVELAWMNFAEVEMEKKMLNPKLMITIAFAILLLGFLLGHLIWPRNSHEAINNSESALVIHPKPATKPYDPQKSYNYYQDEFDKEELTFATVQQCQKWIKDTILKDNLQGKLQNFDQFKEIVDAYNNVVNTILTEDGIEPLLRILNYYKHPDGSFVLNQIHIDLIRKAYHDNGKIIVQKGYITNHRKFKTFMDFNICDPVKKPQQQTQTQKPQPQSF